jgi:hypothetical protein
MDANLLAAEPTALALGELEKRFGDHQLDARAHEDNGKEAEVDGSPGGASPVHAASISIALAALVVAQLVWVALLVYGAYLAVAWLPF